MKTKHAEITPLEWTEAKELENLLKSSGNSGQALVVDPKQGVTHATPVDLISSNENVNGSVRFGIHG